MSISMIVFVFIIILQFFAPVLANKIQARFLVLNYKMKSDPLSSWVNITNFWSEAKNKNKELNDSIISKYILIYHLWWGTAILAMVGVFFGI